MERLPERRHIHVAKYGNALVQQAQRSRPDGNASGKVCGAVNRVNNPAPVLSREDMAIFLAEDAVRWEALGDRSADFPICPLICTGDQAAIAFLSSANLTKILKQTVRLDSREH